MSENPAVHACLARIKAAGGTAWVDHGHLLFRPLKIIPLELMAEARAMTDDVIAYLNKHAVRKPPTEGERHRSATRKDNYARIEGAPTPAQKEIIDRIVWLKWHVHCFDKQSVRDGGLSSHARKEYLAYSNSLERCTMRLEDLRVAAKKEAKRDAGGDQWSTLVTSTAS